MVRIFLDLDARAAGIGEDRVHPLAFEGFDQNLAPHHRAAHLGSLARAGSCLFSCLAHNVALLFGGRPGHKKTHSRFQPWVLVVNLFIRDKRQRPGPVLPPGSAELLVE
jgi:hypothetical protein